MRFWSLFGIQNFPDFGLDIKNFIGSWMWLELSKKIEILIFENHCTIPYHLIFSIFHNEDEEQIATVLIACLDAPHDAIELYAPQPKRISRKSCKSSKKTFCYILYSNSETQFLNFRRRGKPRIWNWFRLWSFKRLSKRP